MRVGIYGRKVGMTQVFAENGAILPVTVVDTSDCYITQVKTKDKDGYVAVQVGYGNRKPQNVNKALAGHFKKAGVGSKARVQEIRFEAADDLSALKAGQKLSLAMFSKGDRVDVCGKTKGRGTTGVMKRWNFSGKDATHGTSKYFRHGGSNGSNTFPGRVIKNKGMPGHYGDEQVTIPNLEVIEVKAEQNLLLLKGAVPGPRNGVVLIRATKRAPAPQGRVLAQ